MTDFATRRRTMVDTQVRPSDVTEFPIIDAMLAIPREAFVPRDKVEIAYADDHVDLGDGRVVMAPRSLAKLLEALDIGKDDLVLDIGAGLGYSSAVIARIAEAVVAVEDDAARVAEAQALLSDNNADNVVLHHGPLAEGAADHAPFDAMIVQGAVEQLPDTLIAQVKDGGRIACLFMENGLGVARLGYKIDGTVTWRFAFNASAPVIPGFEKPHIFAL